MGKSASKRNQIFHLTKTDKKGRVGKETLIEQVKVAIDAHKHIYVFKAENMRNSFMNAARTQWKTSRFFFGRNRVMAKALGDSPENEARPELRLISEQLAGNVGLLFTDAAVDQVERESTGKDFARGGGVAKHEVVMLAGPLLRGSTPVPHNMETQLRKLGMPTELNNGVVHLRGDYTVCSAGAILTPEQAQVLKHFDIKMADFNLLLVCHWTDGVFEMVDGESQAIEMEN